MVKNEEEQNGDAIMAIKYDNVQNPLARFAKSAPQTDKRRGQTGLTQNNFKKLKKEMPRGEQRAQKWQQN